MQNTRLIRSLLTLADSMPDMVPECAILEEAAEKITTLEIELAAMRGAANSYKEAYNNLLAALQKKIEMEGDTNG